MCISTVYSVLRKKNHHLCMGKKKKKKLIFFIPDANLISIIILPVDHYRAETPHIANIFLKKGPYLKLYNTYIRDFQKLTAALEEASVKSPLFQTALKEFEVRVCH